MVRHGEVTQLLQGWSSGDAGASEELFSRVYAELRAIATRHADKCAGGTITPTVLINEAFIQMAGGGKNAWRDRAQFFAFSATVMRRLMVTYARKRSAEKRGGGLEFIALNESVQALAEAGVEMTNLDEALTALASVDAMQAKIVELRFFGGLSCEETATTVNLSVRSVNRQWGLAKVWLSEWLRLHADL